MFQEDDAGSSDTEDSSGRGSDSAVESSSDEGERSSGDSGSSTSESENGSGTEDADDYNPFGGDMNGECCLPSFCLRGIVNNECSPYMNECFPCLSMCILVQVRMGSQFNPMQPL